MKNRGCSVFDSLLASDTKVDGRLAGGLMRLREGGKSPLHLHMPSPRAKADQRYKYMHIYRGYI